MDGSTPSRVVYRAVIGAYEELREEPVAKTSDVDWVCFTDDPTLTSETWRVVVVEPRLAGDAIRSVRHLKIVGHPELAPYDEWLWVDNTVELVVPPEKILDEWLSDADVAAPLHSFRASVLAEAEAVLDAGRDDAVRVYEQLSTYQRHHHDRLDANPHWTGILARRTTPVVDAAMATWWEHVLRFSHRDQLSFVVTVPRDDLRLRSVQLDNLVSALHRWPRASGRRTDRAGTRLREALRPPAAELAALRAQVAAVEVERDQAASTGEAALAAVQDQHRAEASGRARAERRPAHRGRGPPRPPPGVAGCQRPAAPPGRAAAQQGRPRTHRRPADVMSI